MTRLSMSFGTIAVGLLLAGSAPAQEISEILDSSGGGVAALDGPRGVALDALGNVYVAGGYSNNCYKITPFGVITEIIDATGDGVHPFADPFALAADAAGNVYIPGNDSHNAFKITPGGTITQIIDSTGDGLGNSLIAPIGVAVGPFGNVFVTGGTSNNVFKITPAGVITEVIDVNGDGLGHLLLEAQEVDVDHLGNLYVSGAQSDNVFKVTPGGVITQLIDDLGDGLGGVMDFPSAIDVDPVTNDVYVTGYWSNNAFRISQPGGAITEIIDVTGDGLGNAFRRPYGTAFDPTTGDVIMAGYVSKNVFRITPGGVITELIDNTGDGQGNPLACPLGLRVDDHGNVFLSGHLTANAFKIGGSPGSFCDAWDGSLASCPCANPGNPDSGCDIAQGTGGVRFDVAAQVSGPLNRATLVGSGYPPTSAPGVTVLRSTGLDPAAPVVFGDGLRCMAVPVVRVGATLAAGGVSSQTIGHGDGPGAGTFYYQLWIRNTPTMFCDPAAAFNLSNGRAITWP